MNSGFYGPERSNLGLQLTSPKSVAEICNPLMSAIDIAFIHDKIFLSNFFQHNDIL